MIAAHKDLKADETQNNFSLKEKRGYDIIVEIRIERKGGTAMTAKECIKGRRSIRKFKDTKIDHAILEDIIETASYSPSWKHTQIVRDVAIEGELKDKIGRDCTTAYPGNGTIIQNAPMLIAVTVIKNRCGYERDGSFTTPRGDTWQMFDAGVASRSYTGIKHLPCIAPRCGKGTVSFITASVFYNSYSDEHGGILYNGAVSGIGSGTVSADLVL